MFILVQSVNIVNVNILMQHALWRILKSKINTKILIKAYLNYKQFAKFALNKDKDKVKPLYTASRSVSVSLHLTQT